MHVIARSFEDERKFLFRPEHLQKDAAEHKRSCDPEQQ
jgi:hypothetical protein